MPQSIITLTTDFGTSDGYVASMKGVVLSISRDSLIVDISHDVPPQDVAHAAFVLASAADHFPPDTVHVAVVDPGVGTSRRALLLVAPTGRFIAPDNGLLTYVLRDLPDRRSPDAAKSAAFLEPVVTPLPGGCSAYKLTRGEYWRHPVSTTFHGRDIFAPVAAHVARGVAYEELGDPVDRVVCLNVPPPTVRSDDVEGRIIFVDRFGNLVSNIREDDIPEGELAVEIANGRIAGLSTTYSEGTRLVALIGSHGYLEIAAPKGDAATTLGAGVGSEVRVVKG